MPDASSPENVIAVSFEEDRSAYEAMTALKELGTQGRLEIHGAAVVARGEDGRLEQKDWVTGGDLDATATGGPLGLLIGILAGPFGLLLGGWTGALIGSVIDLQDADETDSALGEISQSLPAGHTALVAHVAERSPEVVDTAMAKLGGTVTRRPVDELLAEIAAAEEAQRQAQADSRRALRAARREQRQEAVQAKVAELQAKLHPPTATASKS
jgi:uncharacterized membrane protein